MNESTIRVGSHLRLELTVKQNGSAVDISSATTKEYVVRKPTGDTFTVVASFKTTGDDGVLQFQFLNELDVAGIWRAQVNLEMPGWSGKSTIMSFEVFSNL